MAVITPARLISVALALLAVSARGGGRAHVVARGGARRVVLAVDAVGEYRTYLADACAAHGAELELVWSEALRDSELEQPSAELRDDERAELEENLAPCAGDELRWACERYGAGPGAHAVAAVLCVSDHGLPTSERLAHALGVCSNGIVPARRDKLGMAEAARAAGLDAPRQRLCARWDEAAAFLASLPQPVPCVLKPRRGVASVGVFKASSVEEAHAAFVVLKDMPVSIDTSVRTPGGAVLVQELVPGTEYALDTVSSDGQHKAVHAWRYDKRAANGGHFVYHATILCGGPGAGGAEARDVARATAFARQVLDALGVRWGPCHLEVMLPPAPRGPVLIEANVGRWHGTPYCPLLGDLAQGYNAFGATLDAYLDPAAWAAIPAEPAVSAHARMVHLVLSERGRVRAVRLPVPGGDADCAMPTLIESESKLEVGDLVERPTTDLRSDAGHALLVSRDRAAVERDYAALLERQRPGGGMFELEPLGGARADESEGAEAAAFDVPSCVAALLRAGVRPPAVAGDEAV